MSIPRYGRSTPGARHLFTHTNNLTLLGFDYHRSPQLFSFSYTVCFLWICEDSFFRSDCAVTWLNLWSFPRSVLQSAKWSLTAKRGSWRNIVFQSRSRNKLTGWPSRHRTVIHPRPSDIWACLLNDDNTQGSCFFNSHGEDSRAAIVSSKQKQQRWDLVRLCSHAVYVKQLNPPVNWVYVID